jgi:hypothetical protein
MCIADLIFSTRVCCAQLPTPLLASILSATVRDGNGDARALARAACACTALRRIAGGGACDGAWRHACLTRWPCSRFAPRCAPARDGGDDASSSTWRALYLSLAGSSLISAARYHQPPSASLSEFTFLVDLSSCASGAALAAAALKLRSAAREQRGSSSAADVDARERDHAVLPDTADSFLEASQRAAAVDGTDVRCSLRVARRDGALLTLFEGAPPACCAAPEDEQEGPTSALELWFATRPRCARHGSPYWELWADADHAAWHAWMRQRPWAPRAAGGVSAGLNARGTAFFVGARAAYFGAHTFLEVHCLDFHVCVRLRRCDGDGNSDAQDAGAAAWRVSDVSMHVETSRHAEGDADAEARMASAEQLAEVLAHALPWRH